MPEHEPAPEPSGPEVPARPHTSTGTVGSPTGRSPEPEQSQTAHLDWWDHAKGWQR